MQPASLLSRVAISSAQCLVSLVQQIGESTGLQLCLVGQILKGIKVSSVMQPAGG